MTETLLYGHNPQEGVVSINFIEESKMRVYVRDNGNITSQDFDYYPFFHLSDVSYLNGYTRKYWVKQLQGDNYFQYLVAFKKLFDLWDCVHFLINNYNSHSKKKAALYTDLPFLYLKPEPVSQFLIQTGISFYKGLKDIRRAQITMEIQRRAGARNSNPDHPDDKILCIGLSDNTGWELLIGKTEKNEIEIIQKFIAVIIDRNPDIIEAFHLHQLLTYISVRCKYHKIEFNIGRNNSQLQKVESTYQVFEKYFDYPLYRLEGRELLDTHELVKYFGIGKNILSNYKLKTVAEHLGFEDEGIKVSSQEKSDRLEHSFTNCLISLKRLEYITHILTPPFIEISKFFPHFLEEIVHIGNLSKIDSIFLREYVRRKHSIPIPQHFTFSSTAERTFFLRGLFSPVLLIDLETILPKILINENIISATDKLAISPMILKEFLTVMNTTRTTDRNPRFTPEQLILYENIILSICDSFYFYLSSPRALFNDFEAAKKAQNFRQDIINQVINSISSRGGRPVIIDVDGVFFVPPVHVVNEAGENSFVQRINLDIPESYKVYLSRRYNLMLSYKKKNYAALDYDNKIILRGTGIISKSMEKFAANFLQQCIDRLLNQDYKSLHNIYVQIRRDILNHNLKIHDIMKTETIKEPMQTYLREVEEGSRNRSAVYELAKDSMENVKVGDKINYYITGNDANVIIYQHCKTVESFDPNFPDENTQYYLKKIEELANKFEVFFKPEDFQKIFSADELFEFANEDIKPIITEISEEQIDEDEDSGKDTDTFTHTIELAEN